MEDSILSSPVMREYKAGDMWPTPVRSAVRSIKRDGKGYKTIRAKTGIPLLTIKRICKGESSRTTRKGKACKPTLLKQADIKCIFRFVQGRLYPEDDEKLPSSPDLNPIEKIWRWIKHEITNLEVVPTTKEDMKEVLRELWPEVKPKDWRYLTERLTCVTLRGWLYAPTTTTPENSLLPCLVMVHGFSTAKEMGLDRYAEAFVAELKLAVLVYDNRGFGASDTVPGQPHQEIIPMDQISDFQDAITYAQSLLEVDGGRIGIWGTSYNGGHALIVAAGGRFSYGPTCFSRLIRPDFVPALEAGFEAERQARAAGHPAVTIPIADPNPMAQSAIPMVDTWNFFNGWA
ncbi:hypothetical protein G7Y89_g2802 [Cudoniella acicularis]|uniref:AB hydrolase-1 domain-containing protein n=1 Tax=Cudoniella acicularis TaxID=354080 RepID=A0A8H4RUF2_9HELO|nr:hypothetical protein G7Y89_g2802 [Cudoniella acicularis]